MHDILDTVLGGFTDDTHAAIFGLNLEPTEAEINAAIRDAKVYGNAVNRLVERIGLEPGLYAKDQPIFGPVVRMLSLAGWTVSGSGYFSIGFYKGGLAIKFSLRGKTDAALDYLKWCRDHQGKPGIPTLYAIGEEEFSYVVLMDRYEPIALQLDRRTRLYDPHLAAEFREVKGIINQGEAVEVPFETAETAELIRKTFLGNVHFDIHPGNCMRDRDGNLVITDPLGRSVVGPASYGGYDYCDHTGCFNEKYCLQDGYSQAA